MNDNYRLHISGESSDLEQSLRAIAEMMDKIESRNLSAPVSDFIEKLKEVEKLTRNVQQVYDKQKDRSFVSAGDMDKTIESTKEATKYINELSEAIERVKSFKEMDGAKPGSEAEAYVKLNQVLKQTKERLEEVSSVTIGKDSSINAVIKDMERLGTLTDDYYESVNRAVNANERLKQVRLTNNRVRRNLEKSEISGNMSFQQGVETQQGINSVHSLKKDRATFDRQKEQIRQQIGESKHEQQNLTRQFASGEINRRQYEKERARIESTNRAREKEIQTTEKLIRAMDTSIQYFEETASEQFRTRTYDMQRGTMRRTIAERAPSIASHATMGVGAFLGGLYMRGSSLSEANRPYTVSLGQQIGETDYNAVRHDFEDLSLNSKLGYNSTDMLKFASDYTGSVGYTSRKNLDEGAFELAKGGKALGIADDQTYRESMNVIQKTGAIGSGTDIRKLQSAFAGGIKDSGMTGHQEEQLKSLSVIAENVGQGKTLSNNELGTITAMQSQMASTKSRGMMGEQGANLMTGLNAGMQDALSSPFLRQALGWGTKFQGIDGMYAFQKQVNKGITDPDNLTAVYNKATQYASNDEGKRVMFFEALKDMSPEVNIDQSDSLYDLMQKGDLSKESLQKEVTKLTETGEKERDKNHIDYTKSKAGKNDLNKARTDSKAEDVYDWAQPARDVNSALASLNTAIYVTIGAVGAFSASLLASGMMMGGASVLNKGLGRFKNKGMSGKGIGGPKGGGIKGMLSSAGSTVATAFGVGDVFGFDTPEEGKNTRAPKTPKAPAKSKVGRAFQGFQGLWGADGNLLDKRDKARGVVSDKTKGIRETVTKQPYVDRFRGMWGKNGTLLDDIDKLKGTAKGLGKTAVSKGAEGGKGLLGKIGNLFKGGKGPSGIIETSKGMGKAMPLLGTALSAISLGSALASGDNTAIGSTAGSIGGATIGGAIGTAVLPGIGTAVGAGIGSVGGSWLGGKIGEKVKDKPSFKLWDKPKDGDYGLLGNMAIGAWGGISSLFKKKDKPKPQKESKPKTKDYGPGKGGGSVDPVKTDTPSYAPGMEPTVIKEVKETKESKKVVEKQIDPTKKNTDDTRKGGVNPADKGSNNPGGGFGLWGLLTGIGAGIGSGISSLFGGNEAEASELSNPSDKKVKGRSNKNNLNEVKSETDTKQRMEAERLREKNNISETSNLAVYRNLLNQAEQLINEAKSLDFGGTSGGESEGGESGGTVGSLTTITDGSKWTNKDTTKHDLGKTAEGVDAESLNKWIDAVAPKNSTMRGMGKDFIEAGKASGMDPRYLVAHAAIETGWGTSNLSKGGDKKNGNWFGIGAFDNNPNNGFNYSDGLTGGAKWIAENFYSAGQTTLEKMRFNGGVHEYATDPNWASSIGKIMAGSDQFISGGTKKTAEKKKPKGQAGKGGRDFSQDTKSKAPSAEQMDIAYRSLMASMNNKVSERPVAPKMQAPAPSSPAPQASTGNTVNINVSIEKGKDAEQTAKKTANEIGKLFKKDMDVFSNQHRRV